MLVTITSIELKSIWHFFSLSKLALGIVKQLKACKPKAFKKTGSWTTHYTMTLWENEDQMKAFAHSGKHLESMQKSKNISKEIITLSYKADSLPSWKEAKSMLSEKGKRIRFE